MPQATTNTQQASNYEVAISQVQHQLDARVDAQVTFSRFLDSVKQSLADIQARDRDLLGQASELVSMLQSPVEFSVEEIPSETHLTCTSVNGRYLPDIARSEQTDYQSTNRITEHVSDATDRDLTEESYASESEEITTSDTGDASDLTEAPPSKSEEIPFPTEASPREPVEEEPLYRDAQDERFPPRPGMPAMEVTELLERIRETCRELRGATKVRAVASILGDSSIRRKADLVTYVETLATDWKWDAESLIDQVFDAANLKR